SLPRVLNRDLDVTVSPRRAHGNLSSAGRDLDRVREEIGEDLKDPIGIGANRKLALRELRFERDGPGAGERTKHAHRVPDELRRVELVEDDVELAGSQPREVKQVGNQPVHLSDRPLKTLQALRAAGA